MEYKSTSLSTSAGAGHEIISKICMAFSFVRVPEGASFAVRISQNQEKTSRLVKRTYKPPLTFLL
jgi:hypothetical protein